MTFSGCLWLVYLTCTLLALVSPAPMLDQYSQGLDWLSRYGYLPPPDPHTGKLQTKEGIERAIKEMQRFAGLKDTGKLDIDTLKLMNTPRCSLPDIIGSEDKLKKRRRKRRYATTGLRWKKSEVTWSIHNYPSLPPFLNPSEVNNIMAYALKAWSDVTNLEFRATSSNKQDKADIKISFGRMNHEDGYPFDGKGGTLAHAFFPGEADISGDTHFDDDESWTYKGASGYLKMPWLPALGGILKQEKHIKTIPKSSHTCLAKTTETTSAQTTKPDPSVLDRCKGDFDAVADIRGEVFFFKGQYFWRIQQSGSLVSFEPVLIKNFWFGLPPGTNKIDAVYERQTDSRIIFFIGSQYWVFKDNMAMSGYPRPLSDWGLISHDGSEVRRVDAAFIWAHNGKTYIFSGGEYWRFSGTEKSRADADYPKNAILWTGVPSNPDDIITGRDGDCYFFKNNSYWILKNGELDNVSQKSTAVDWMMCPEPTKLPDNPRQRGEYDCDQNRALQMSASSWLLLIILLLYPGVLI
ncbi:matrix metalloproteinase-25-like [Carassius gibelio]|uniref:matrix metalloproteinase-25-like n=1 Tax=Carassius gibelio TaxID=101364 RepID=UPI0022798954|nr:matrix metalloproteinase-25-like [Carassius gibelio]